MITPSNSAKLFAIPMVAVLLLLSQAFAQTSALTVETDAASYTTGEPIIISGDAGENTGQPLLVQVFNPNGDAYRFDQVEVADDGSYSYEMVVGGNLGVTGTYSVIVTYNDERAETEFDFTAEGEEPEATGSEVTIDGTTYTIPHSGGSVPAWVGAVTADTDAMSLTMAVNNTEDETLELELDRSLIDTEAECFTVMIDGAEAEAECSPIDDDTVLLTVQVPAGASEVEIIGSFLIPEFGAIAVAVLAGVVAMTIVATRRQSLFGTWK